MVTRLSDYIIDRTDTNRDFADVCAALCISTAVGENVFISNKIGVLPLNIFGIIIGGSGISNKTVAINIVRRIVRLMNRDLFPNLDEKYGLLVPVKFTIEAMTNWFKEKQNLTGVIPEGAIVADEYTKMFMGAKNRDYLATTMEYLSTLYDGYVDKTVTIARGVEEVERVYVNFVSATTFYLLKLMDVDFFIQGNGTRILWCFDDQHDPEEMTPEEIDSFFTDIIRMNESERRLFELVDELVRLRRMVLTARNGLIILSIDAMRMLSRYRLEKKNFSISLYKTDWLNPDANYISRLAQNAMKLAAIHCMGRYTGVDIWDDAHVMLTDVDAQWGISKVENYFKSYLKIRDAMALMSSESQTSSFQADHQKVLRVIDKWGGQASKSQLISTTRWRLKELDNTLEDMVTAGIIDFTEVRTAGRPAVIYRRKQR